MCYRILRLSYTIKSNFYILNFWWNRVVNHSLHVFYLSSHSISVCYAGIQHCMHIFIYTSAARFVSELLIAEHSTKIISKGPFLSVHLCYILTQHGSIDFLFVRWLKLETMLAIVFWWRWMFERVWWPVRWTYLDPSWHCCCCSLQI